MATFYARITPTHGVSGDVYSVSISGVTGTVEGQKTWTGGELSFAITPTGSGVMTITFKNLTLNQTIGTKTVTINNNEAVPLGNLNMGSFTLLVGRSDKVGTSDIYYYGKGVSTNGKAFGTISNNTANYYGAQIIPKDVWLMRGMNVSFLSIQFEESSVLPLTLKYDVKYTNLSTNQSKTFMAVNRNPAGWSGGILTSTPVEDPGEISDWESMFTLGQQIKIELLVRPGSEQV